LVDLPGVDAGVVDVDAVAGLHLLADAVGGLCGDL